MSWLIVFMSYLLPVVLLPAMLATDRWRRAHSKMVPIKVRHRGRQPSPIR